MKSRPYRILAVVMLLFTAGNAVRAVEGTTTQPYIHIPGKSLANKVLPFPPASQDWEVKYIYIVPPIPNSKTWNPRHQTFYLWGDIDFDTYAAGAPSSLSPYKFNQIIPELMIGPVLTSHDRNYKPSWRIFDSWVILAAYYWKDDKNNSYAQTGSVVHVSPGDSITSLIRYTAETGAITVTIQAPGGESRITIDRPFPNEQPPLFANWRDFFEQAEGKTRHLYGHMSVQIETYEADQDTICSIFPFIVHYIVYPGVPPLNETFWLGDPCDKEIGGINLKP